MEKLWTTGEVAEYLGITEDEVEQLVKQGRLTGYKLGGQFLRFRPDQAMQLRGAVASRPGAAAHPMPRPFGSLRRAKDFVYFHDFYIVSAMLLAVLVVYLIAAG